MNKSKKFYEVINKIIIIISKIAEVCCWVGSGFLVAMTIAVAVGRTFLVSLLSSIEEGAIDLDGFGFNMSVNENAVGQTLDLYQIPSALILFFLASLAACVLMALVFRNVNLIFKTAEGKTKFSTGATPFQPANVRMMREIGIYLIALPIVQFIMSLVSAGVLRGFSIDVNVEGTTLIVGLVVLALSQFFAYGVKLQEDVDGLV